MRSSSSGGFRDTESGGPAGQRQPGIDTGKIVRGIAVGIQHCDIQALEDRQRLARQCAHEFRRSKRCKAVADPVIQELTVAELRLFSARASRRRGRSMQAGTETRRQRPYHVGLASSCIALARLIRVCGLYHAREFDGDFDIGAHMLGALSLVTVEQRIGSRALQNVAQLPGQIVTSRRPEAMPDRGRAASPASICTATLSPSEEWNV